MSFDEWFSREGRHMVDAGCPAETVARAAYFVAIHQSRKHDAARSAFVRGAKWWQYRLMQSTAFPSEVDLMEVEALRLYPNDAQPDKETT